MSSNPPHPKQRLLDILNFAKERKRKKIGSNRTRCTIFPIAVETVVMSWNIAGCIKSFALGVVIVAPKVFNTSVCAPVANVTIWTVVVIIATTKMVMAAIATDREHLRAVGVLDAT